MLKNWLEILIGFNLTVVVTATFLQVLFRFVLKIPAPWTEEITRFAFAYMVFLGAALAVKHHRHLSVDVINGFPRTIRSVIIGLSYGITIIFVGILTYYGWIHTLESKIQTTPTLEISLMYMYMIIPVSGVLMLFYLVKGLIIEFRGLREGAKQV